MRALQYIFVSILSSVVMLVTPACDKKSSENSDRATVDSNETDAVHKNPLFTKEVVIKPMVEECQREKSDLEFANAVIQNMFGRDINEFEKNTVREDGFDRISFVDKVLGMPEADNGYSRFISNLFLLSNIQVDMELEDEELVRDTTLVSHLQQEPIELVLRNKDKPWPWFFTTRDIYCTEATAGLYNYTLVDTVGFSSCQLPEDRAGFLGMASVLRAIPSDFVSVNNNYKRVAFALYLSKGMKLLAKTNGPKGEGPGLPLHECVPLTDMRVTDDGLAFGTARIPVEGSVCAGCHSPYNGPMSVAFRRFKDDGSSYSFEDIDQINGDDLNGANRDSLKYLLNETESCWSFDGNSPPRTYNGLPGLARLIVESESLGKALGIQIPQLLGNREPSPNLQTSIENYYEDGDKMLSAAFKGYLLSDTFQCAD